MRNDPLFDAIQVAVDPLKRELFDAATGKSGSSLQRFLFGVVAGAAVALLFAPHAGNESRRWVKDRSRRLRDGAGDRLGVVKDALHDGAEVVRQSVAAGRDAYHSARAESRSAITSEV